MKKILLFLLAILVMGSCVTYAYQIPYKKYVAEKELYQLLENEHGLEPDEIHIIQVIKDIKSVIIVDSTFLFRQTCKGF